MALKVGAEITSICAKSYGLTIDRAWEMDITDGAAWAIGLLTTAVSAANVWMYGRVSRVHDRMDKIANHMTSEDNKLHSRIDAVMEKLAYIAVLDNRMENFGKTQDKMLKEVEELNGTMRHRIGNMEQVAVRADERLNHLEKTQR